MKIKDFTYEKKDGKVNDYEVMMLNETETHVAGIDLKKLSEDEAKAVKSIQEDYEEKLKPFMKAYRSFIKENIQAPEKKR